MNILIMGPAGAGKGTMSDLILKEYNIAHISTGDMLRENVRNSTALGLEAQSYMNQGKLVPDDLINAMVEDRIQQPDCANGYLLDGFPRTLVQAEVFDKIAKKIGKEVDAVIDCGAIYHIHNHPSKVEGVCDVCGSELQQRKDDTVEQLKVRMEAYESSTKPVIDYYDQKGVVTHIDAAQKPEKVFEDIKKALEKNA